MLHILCHSKVTQILSYFQRIRRRIICANLWGFVVEIITWIQGEICVIRAVRVRCF